MNKVLASKAFNYREPSANSLSNNNNNTHIQQSKQQQNQRNSNMKPTPPQTPQQQQECHLDELGYCFVKKCIQIIEARGLDDQGLYRIGGVNSRVARLLQMCLDTKNYDQNTGKVSMPDFSDPVEWETKTITSALKNYLRNLSEPLMTYNLHPSVIEAAKIENAETRTHRIKSLIQQLPTRNFTLLKILVKHLRNVASHSQKNLMTVSNLSICFAPTLMRGPEEDALSIMEIKYSNVVANTLIDEYDSIFNDPRLNQSAQQHHHQFHNNLPQRIQFASTPHITNNHEDHFGLGPPPPINQQYNNNLQHHIQFANIPHIASSHEEQFGLGLPPTNQPQYYPWSNISHQNHLNHIPYYPSPLNANKLPYRSDRVITLYACVADTESELSFGPNE